MKTVKRIFAAALMFALLIGAGGAALPVVVGNGSDSGGGLGAIGSNFSGGSGISGSGDSFGSGGAVVPGGAALVAEKSEVVYARLSGGGEVQGIYVVNQFVLDSGGMFSDFGNYSSVVNLTDMQPLTVSGGEVSAMASGEDFFYQGNLFDTDLPWLYSIVYTLDGMPIAPGNLAGRSGRLEIHIASEKNEAIDETFYSNYLQQISVTLSIIKCRNISAAGATAANAGMNRVLAYTVLPGSDADIRVTADVVDFEMPGIEITAMPFTMSFAVPDISAMLGDFTELSDAIVGLRDGTGMLRDGAAEMSAGAELLRDGSAGFYNGLSQLSGSSAQITDASAQFQAALSQFAQIAAGLETLGPVLSADPSMAPLIELIYGISALSENYSTFHSGLIGYTQGLGGLANGYGEIDSGIADLSGGVSGMFHGISELYDGTAMMASETAGIPQQMQSGIDSLLGDYLGDGFDAVSFTSGKNENINFVQFVFMTEGINKPEPETAAHIETEQSTFVDRFVRLFTG